MSNIGMKLGAKAAVLKLRIGARCKLERFASGTQRFVIRAGDDILGVDRSAAEAWRRALERLKEKP